MNKHTKPTTSKKPKTKRNTGISGNTAPLNEIRDKRYIIALDRYLGFEEVTGSINKGISTTGYEFDFMVWPKWNFVKIFANLDTGEVEKYAQHPEAHQITFIIDVDQYPRALAKLEKGRIIRCTLTPDAFRAAQALNAYIYFQRRIWTSHMGMNLWEPLLPMEDRILRARDWELTQPAPATVITKRS